jgi:hypothetical protein
MRHHSWDYGERDAPLPWQGEVGWGLAAIASMRPPLQKSYPRPKKLPHTPTHPRHTRGPDAGSGGEAGKRGASLRG